MGNVGIRADALGEEEFESFANELCKIIFSNQRIHGFPRGKDDGIDGIDDIQRPTIVVQAKRWTPGKTTARIAINEEISKIRATASKYHWDRGFKYVFVTSTGLPPNVQHEVLRNNSDLFPSDECLIDSARINDFASDLKFRNLYCQYGLLGADLTSILKKDRLTCLDDDYLDFDPKYYVETSFLDDAYEIVKNKHIIFIHGNPGVGKTTLCKMLGMLFANASHQNTDTISRILWRTADEAGDVLDIYNSGFKGTDNQLFVVFDDFLGSNSLDTNTTQIQKLNRLMSHMRLNSNLFIVLNSRTHILNSAKQEFTDFAAKLDGEYKETIEMIDMSEYSDIDKAKLLRKTLEQQFNRLTDDATKSAFSKKYDELREESGNASFLYRISAKKYNKIIKHHNFNPRLIEFISQRFTETNDVLNFIFDTLNNPKWIYNAPFENLDVNEKWLLFCLYAFKTKGIPQDKLQKAVACFKQSDFDMVYALKQFERAWVKTEQSTLGKLQIDFANPGIADFLAEKDKSIEFTKKIINETTLLYQIQNLLNKKNFYSILLQRWDTFQDADDYIGEYVVAFLLYGTSEEKVLYLLRSTIMIYDGAWRLDSSNGWAKIFDALRDSKFNVLTDVLHMMVDNQDDLTFIHNIFESEMSMLEFDGIVDVLLPEIERMFGIDISNQKYSLIDENTEGYALITTIFKKRTELFQSELDDSNNYSDDIDKWLADGESVDSISDRILQEISENNFGDLLDLYDDIDDLDVFNITSFVEDSESELSRNEDDEGEYYHRSNLNVSSHFRESSETLDLILDRPIGK